MALGFVFSLYQSHWLNAFLIAGIIFLSVLPLILGDQFKVYIPAEFEFLSILLLFGSLFLGEMHGYYTRFWWWDLALHTGSGFLLGIFGFLLVHILNQEERIHLHMQLGFVALFSFVFSMAMGTLWEIFEFAVDNAFGMDMQRNLRDTMWDLIVNAVGALTISIAGYFYFKSKKNYFLEDWIYKFIQKNPKIFKHKAGI